jgi:hypothetical protein
MSKRIAIFTVATGEYRHFVPMFRYAAEKAYPECQVIIHESDGFPNMMAAMRFIYDKQFDRFDSVLITDVDILMQRNGDSFYFDRLNFLSKNQTWCYANVSLEKDSCPGVHFVTREWWERTADARGEESENLVNLTCFGDDVPKGYDERMLFRIITASGLKTPPTGLLSHYGVHLGAFRGRKLPELDAIQKNEVATLLSDRVLMVLAEEAGGKSPLIRDIFKNLRKLNAPAA